MRLPLNFSAAAYAQLAEQDQREVVGEFGAAMRERVEGKIRWTAALSRIVAAFVDGRASSSDVDAFWIKLFGVLECIADDGLDDDTFVPTNALQARLLRISNNLRGKGVVLFRVFSENELLLIEFHRHRAAHPFLDSYFLRFTKKAASLRRAYSSKLLKSEISLETLRSLFSDAEGGTAEVQLATALANRVQAPLLDYLQAMTEPHRPFDDEV